MAEVPTERLHPAGTAFQAMTDETILDTMLESHRAAANAVAQAIPALAEGAGLMAAAIGSGHRLIYAGAGSAGLMAIADALEIPVTFGIPRHQIRTLFPGGPASLAAMTGEPEDDPHGGTADTEQLAPVEGDVVICVSASGSTPYTLAVAETAKGAGASLIAIANVPGSPVLSLGGVSVLLDTGPEIVAGSTRLGAGTAQKIALNMLSTLMGVRLGHVYAGRMVNMTADNGKLRARAENIVREISGAGLARARSALEETGGRIKPAVLVARADLSKARAEALLARHGGQLGPALLEL